MRAGAGIASLARRAAGFAAPPRCAICGGWTGDAAPACEACLARLAAQPRWLGCGPPGIERLAAAWRFEGAARELVHSLKYGRRLRLARLAAAEMAAAATGAGVAAAAGGWGGEGGLVPVPASPLRRAWRGFDPAEEIALALAPLLGLELRRCLRRRHGPRQVGRPRSRRLADPPRVTLARRARVPTAAVLVDDVCTTGATLAACAAALREAGCRRVEAVVVARAARGPSQ